MLSSLKLQASVPPYRTIRYQDVAGDIPSSTYQIKFRLAPSRFACLSLQPDNASSKPSISSNYTATVGSPPHSIQLSHCNLTNRHIMMLNVIACAAAISATWLFCSAIPALLAFRRAAESMEKLLDLTREELPDTMAAIRLSGMEISDLTMELSDLGQEITQGVKSSTRAVRLAEERLRGLTNMAPSATVQDVIPMGKNNIAEPMLARSARGIKEGIVKGRSLLQMFFTFTRFSRIAFNYFRSRAKS